MHLSDESCTAFWNCDRPCQIYNISLIHKKFISSPLSRELKLRWCGKMWVAVFQYQIMYALWYRFFLTKFLLPKHGKAQVNRCWVECVNVTTKLEDVRNSFQCGFIHQVGSILFEDAIVSILIGSCKWWFWNIFTQTQMIRFGVMNIKCNNQISQTFTVWQLTKHQSKQLIPSSNMFDISISFVLFDDTTKLIFI